LKVRRCERREWMRRVRLQRRTPRPLLTRVVELATRPTRTNRYENAKPSASAEGFFLYGGALSTHRHARISHHHIAVA